MRKVLLKNYKWLQANISLSSPYKSKRLKRTVTKQNKRIKWKLRVQFMKWTVIIV